MPFRVYGVSALGGDLEKDLKALQDHLVPSDRIKVVAGSTDTHGDVTGPIRRLLLAPLKSERGLVYKMARGGVSLPYGFGMSYSTAERCDKQNGPASNVLTASEDRRRSAVLSPRAIASSDLHKLVYRSDHTMTVL